jgi:hypothetical protein
VENLFHISLSTTDVTTIRGLFTIHTDNVPKCHSRAGHDITYVG